MIMTVTKKNYKQQHCSLRIVPKVCVHCSLFFIFLFSFFFSNCDPDGLNFKLGPDEELFYAQNFKNNKPYPLGAKLIYTGESCEIYVEQVKGKGIVSYEDAKEMADVFDNEIYPKLLNAFGNNFLIDGVEYDTMQIADLIGDGNGKLCILLLDIKDGYERGKDGGYVAGYFHSLHFTDLNNSNKRDMIFVDANPGEPGTEESNQIVAHEMQHMMNYVTRIILNSNGLSKGSFMDTWIDEGLSSAAEWVYSGSHSEGRINWYNYNNYEEFNGLISEGNNFFVWGNHEYNPNAILDDYSTVYLFFQWLRIHGDNDIYRKIITSEHVNYMAILDNMAGYNKWEDLLGDWLAANYINAPSGVYGYKGEIEFIINKGKENEKVVKHYINSTEKTANLFPGEGVFSYMAGESSIYFPGNSEFIRYSGVNENSVAPVGMIHPGWTLLTYNANTISTGNAANGRITGNLPPQTSVSSSRMEIDDVLMSSIGFLSSVLMADKSILGSSSPDKPRAMSAGEYAALRRQHK